MPDLDIEKLIGQIWESAVAENERRRAGMTPEERAADDVARESARVAHEHANRVSRAMPEGLGERLRLDQNGHQLDDLRHDMGFYTPGTRDEAAQAYASRLYRLGSKLDTRLSEADKDRMVSAYEQGRPLETPVSIADPRFERLDSCKYCGEGMDLMTDGWTIWPKTPCPYPNGYTLHLDLQVPSGKLLVADDLRERWAEADVDDSSARFYINRAFGMKNTIEEYAAHGLLHLYLGNTYPAIYRDEDDRLSIVRPPDESEPSKVGQSRGPVGEIGERWSCIADHDEAVRRGVIVTPDMTVIDVEPGRYVLTYHLLEDGFDEDDCESLLVCATLERQDT